MAIHLFVPNDQVAALEVRLATLQATPRLPALAALAWHQRQRDCARALTLADEADSLLAALSERDLEHRRCSARLLLVRAEVKLLSADPLGAEAARQSAADLFADLGDRAGLGDTHWLAASIALNHGAGDHVADAIKQAIREYRMAGDELRVQSALARQMFHAAFRDPVATALELQQTFPPGVARPSSLATWVEAARANAAGLTNDPGSSIRYDLEAYDAALDSGQLRQALVSVSNAAESFAMLGDLNSALEWSERAVTLARSTGWPANIGLCLMQLGDVMRQLTRHDEARAYLEEALSLMATQTGSRNYALTLGHLGQLALDTGDHVRGLQSFLDFEKQVKLQGAPDLLIRAWRGQASALLHLGRAAEAKLKANAALALAREQANADGQIQALRVLADLHAQHSLPPPEGMTAPSAALHYLRQALDIAAGISGYTVAPELLTQVAAACAASGDHRAAYESQLAAEAARSKTHTEEAHKRALTMQIRTEVELARAETELHRKLAATLRETTATLEIMGTIGREITASLDAQNVFETLHRHVNQLLDATFFAVYLIDSTTQQLRTAFGIEAGVPLPVITTKLDHPTSMFARSVRERREIEIDREHGEDDPNLIPGTQPSLSLLYFPLIVGERLLGAMSIQSPHAHAYGERERSIFRALCAYGAIALDNAAAYSVAATAQARADQALGELRQTQAQLVAQNQQLERLAVTDQLTGLYNRLRLDQTLEEERLRNLRYATAFSVLLLDVDHFKAVNDSYGHPTGDQVLIGIARVLQQSIREIDVVGRWGGEEFLVVCRETTLEGALVLAEKLRQAIQAQMFAQVGRKSVSLGVAVFRQGEALTETIARADAALYRAKEGGRNRVECAA